VDVFVAGLANAGDFSDRLQTRPSMPLLQPVNIRRDHDGAGFRCGHDRVDRGVFRRGLGQRVIKERAESSWSVP